MIYLASPYSHKDEAIRDQRFRDTEMFTAYHLWKGVVLFSPIVYCHQLAKTYDLPKDAEFWKRLNSGMLARALGLWVLRLPGWELSIGVRDELQQAKDRGLPISWKDYPHAENEKGKEDRPRDDQAIR